MRLLVYCIYIVTLMVMHLSDPKIRDEIKSVLLLYSMGSCHGQRWIWRGGEGFGD